MAQENYSTEFYKKQLEKLSIELKKYTFRSRIWVIVRLTSFLGIIVFAYFTYPYQLFSIAGIIAQIVLFLFFVRKSAENTDQLNFIKQLIKINENEIKAAHHDFTAFYDGNEYIDSSHPFSYDMDLFGKRSFFQFFNRTVTKGGEKKLVERLLNGISAPKKSAEAIDELTNKKEWCQEYLAHGSSFEKEEADIRLTELLKLNLLVPSWIKVIRFIIPVLAVFVTTLAYLSIINGLVFILLALVLLFPIQRKLKVTNEVHEKLTTVGKRTHAIQRQLAILEQEKFTSPLLAQFQTELFRENKNGKQGLTELSKIVKQAEYRNNVLVGVMLNFYLAWDFYLLNKTEKWLSDYRKQVERWEEIVFEMEALISGANFRANFEKHTSIPELKEDLNAEIRLERLGHPIIPTHKLVKNDFTISQQERFAIITGPNMAGKSTFLRSIGINTMLAHAGFHVMAEKFEFPNVKVYSSMRTSDDLKEETSYFHAELLRLRFIVDAIERGEKIFIILDEILKGTNSKDKEEGSSKFLQKLNKLQVKGIIATHDLSLTLLAEKYPEIINKYFDTTISGDEISFDYCIHNGVAKNMNASFLLHKMGLTDN